MNLNLVGLPAGSSRYNVRLQDVPTLGKRQSPDEPDIIPTGARRKTDEIQVHHRGWEQTECAICLDTLLSSADEHRGECGHTFHAKCMVGWTSRGNGTCPLCRRPFAPHELLKRLLHDALNDLPCTRQVEMLEKLGGWRHRTSTTIELVAYLKGLRSESATLDAFFCST
eukprot:CAMPEP_0175993208 /NCGR_PEP_ID=MMETSP0108-20121206/53838_1 /TAXON_ID=195067 ORGANISM="Goniomonas pacifica, Strain CCMP1869" /NCGR_SAMPLE_ID=MMETSP0108 /ASSEMBLY_ACC=CAM_ASM_000204 /LENGTH=168 /DNA_ID=CAMNT_0017324973 /DNA_START=54 /DNA_END=560 /DNA_ORIENTATION=-